MVLSEAKSGASRPISSNCFNVPLSPTLSLLSSTLEMDGKVCFKALTSDASILLFVGDYIYSIYC